jgi:hypothetical protein
MQPAAFIDSDGKTKYLITTKGGSGVDGPIIIDSADGKAKALVKIDGVDSLEPIDDPSSATPEEVATLLNDLLQALKGQ